MRFSIVFVTLSRSPLPHATPASNICLSLQIPFIFGPSPCPDSTLLLPKNTLRAFIRSLGSAGYLILWLFFISASAGPTSHLREAAAYDPTCDPCFTTADRNPYTTPANVACPRGRSFASSFASIKTQQVLTRISCIGLRPTPLQPSRSNLGRRASQRIATSKVSNNVSFSFSSLLSASTCLLHIAPTPTTAPVHLLRLECLKVTSLGLHCASSVPIAPLLATRSKTVVTITSLFVPQRLQEPLYHRVIPRVKHLCTA